MKIKHLNAEFEYFTQKWLICRTIKPRILAYIFI